MAGTITLSLKFAVSNGGYADNQNFQNLTFTQTGLGAAGGVATVNTTSSLMDVGSVTSTGMILMQNLDPTNYITWGLDSSGTQETIGQILPGEVQLLRLLPGQALRWTAHTASVQVYYWLLQA